MIPFFLEDQLLGPASELLPHFYDAGITDILINGTHSLFIEKEGRLFSHPNPFTVRDTILEFLERLCIPLGKRIDASQPYLDGTLVDGSRFHVLMDPIALGGPVISIRKFARTVSLSLRSFGSEDAMARLADEVIGGLNLLIAGGTGSGKTTFLTLLLNRLPDDQRVLLLEEAREVRSTHPHVISLEGRPASPEGRGEVTLRTLLRQSLRMRPDRIVVGECRGPEALEMVQAMSTGHAGSFCTIHASSAWGALRRLECLMQLALGNVPSLTVRQWIATAIHRVAFLKRVGEQRTLVEVLRIDGMEGENYRFTPLLGNSPFLA